MKIAKIINTLDFGGIERVFEIYASYYKGAKQNIVFVALGGGGAAEKFIREQGYRVIILDDSTKIPNIGLIFRLTRLIRKERPDVVHTCGAEANFHGLLAARVCGVKVRIGEEIGIPSHSSVAKTIFRFVFGGASSIIAVAKSVKEYLVVNKEVDASNVEVIYNPVDVDKFSLNKRNPQNEPFLIVTVCRLHAIKNLKALIRAFAKVQNKSRHFELWIVGDGPERADLVHLTTTLDVAASVTFWGYQNDPSAFLSKANLFVLPSFSEGHPVSVIEAMVAELPVAATKVGGASEIIEHSVTGWLIDPNDDDSIVAAIEDVAALSQERLNSITSRARRQAMESFSPDSYLSKLDQLYDRVTV
ncbi:MAG: glycosyltransferase [Chryseolinea sp.]